MTTIYALSSGAGLAAVAVIRVSGPQAGDVLARMAGRGVPPRRAVVRRIHEPENPQQMIDETLVLWLPGPTTFTGEDMAEFHLHGGRAVVATLLEILSRQPGLRLAEPGEFTRRAFEAGRLDLLAVEGLADLIAAESDAQRRQALFHQGGGAGVAFESWRQELLAILARHEAAIDFADEDDIATSALEGVRRRTAKLEDELRSALAGAKRGEAIRDGVRVVIAGPPNAGKSTLLNRLACRDAAIVSHLPGTTRDVVEVRIELAGMTVVVADTAGLREGDTDSIEAEGMARTRQRMTTADIVVWVVSPDTHFEGDEPAIDSETLRVWNKADLGGPTSEHYGALSLCARSGEGVDDLIERLRTRVAARYAMQEPALITRERQRLALEECCLELSRATRSVRTELQAEHVRLAARALERLTGRIDVEETLGAIFAEFCIGK